MGLAFAILILSFLAWRSRDIETRLGRRDFPDYWAGGRLLLERHDPYDQTSFLASQGFAVSQALVLRMPPWAMPLLLPLAVLRPFWAWVLWSALSVIAFLLTIAWFAPAPQFRLLGYIFAPVLCCLVVGQIGLLLLLGIALFLKFFTSRPLVAGAALLLPFAKPHLLALFWLALLFWCAMRRQWMVAAGFAIALLTATSAALALDPAIFTHYRQMLERVPISQDMIPSLSGMLRALFFRGRFWVQFVPLAIGACWCVWYCIRNRGRWDWRLHGMTVLTVSVLVTPYEWFTDESVLLPAVLQAAGWIFMAKTRAVWITRVLSVAFLCLNGLLLLLVLFQVPLKSGLYFWSSTLWFGWYMFGLHRRSRV
jgi:Glycosyltransferase family 87